MRNVKLSDEVWNEIAKLGQFGETEDDVLRRVFKLPPLNQPERSKMKTSGSGRTGRGGTRYAKYRMKSRVERGLLIVEFVETGARHEWKLPKPDDKDGIRQVRDEAVAFALDNGASDPGQTNAVRKALTDAGYHLTKGAI